MSCRRSHSAYSNASLDYSWMWRYTKLVAGIMSTAFGAKTPSYSTVIDLDRKIRDFPIPSILSGRCGQVEDTDLGRSVDVQRYLVMASKEIGTFTCRTSNFAKRTHCTITVILHLHRPYFAQALSELPHDLLKHRFGPSLMATYRSSWRLIEALRDLYRRVPFILGRIPLPWSYSISAAVRPFSVPFGVETSSKVSARLPCVCWLHAHQRLRWLPPPCTS